MMFTPGQPVWVDLGNGQVKQGVFMWTRGKFTSVNISSRPEPYPVQEWNGLTERVYHSATQAALALAKKLVTK